MLTCDLPDKQKLFVARPETTVERIRADLVRQANNSAFGDLWNTHTLLVHVSSTRKIPRRSAQLGGSLKMRYSPVFITRRAFGLIALHPVAERSIRACCKSNHCLNCDQTDAALQPLGPEFNRSLPLIQNSRLIWATKPRSLTPFVCLKQAHINLNGLHSG